MLIDLSQAMCLETKGFRFSDAGSSDLRLGKGIQLIMKALAMAMFFAYSALFVCNPLIINKLIVEAAGVEPDTCVENIQLSDSRNPKNSQNAVSARFAYKSRTNNS